MALAGPVARVVSIAERIISPIRVASVGAAIPASALTYLVVKSVGFDNWLLTTTTVLVTVGLFTPAVILFVFYLGLRQLTSLPGNIAEAVGRGRDHAETLSSHVISARHPDTTRSLTGLLRSIYDLGRLLADSKGMLLGSVGLVRLVNPITLAVVLTSLAATLVWWALLALLGLATIFT